MSNPLLNRLSELAVLFFKLGIIGFGGPVAHIAMIEDEVVKQRQWLTREYFLDLLGATNLIPGPNSTEIAIHVGYVYAGWWGMIVSGVCFISPAILITAIFAGIYVEYGALPQFTPLLYGIKPAVLAVILNAVWGLAKKSVKTRQLLIVGIAVGLVAGFGKLNQVIVLLLGGVLGMFWLRHLSQDNRVKPPGNQSNLLITTGLIMGLTGKTSTLAAGSIPLWQLGWFFVKVGSVLFGGGYLLVAFLQTGLVEDSHWLTQQQLLDAIAIGQFTPGPVLSTATFIGYILDGIWGAIIATIGIFLPSFVFVALSSPIIPKLRNSLWVKAFLDSVNVSAVAIMVIATTQLSISSLTYPNAPYIDIVAVAIALICAILAIGYRLNAAWLVLGGGLVGLATTLF
jgi:chromate transporter